MRVLAFDVYGTLVDVHGNEKTAEPFLHGQSSAFIARRRGLPADIAGDGSLD